MGKLAVLICIAALLAGCGASPFAQYSYVDRTVITAASVTPDPLHAGGLALVDFALGPGRAKYKPGNAYPAVDLPLQSGVSGGAELVPLLPAVYTSGGPLPSLAAARAALGADDPLSNPFTPPAVIRPDQHAYFLLAAPASAGRVQVTFDLGGSAPWAAAARRTLTVDVLP